MLFVVALVFGVLIGVLPGIAGLAVFAILVWWVALEIIAWRARRTETVPDSRREAHSAVIAGVAVAVVGFGLMQAVPYGRDRTAPRGGRERREVARDRPRVRVDGPHAQGVLTPVSPR